MAAHFRNLFVIVLAIASHFQAEAKDNSGGPALFRGPSEVARPAASNSSGPKEDACAIKVRAALNEQILKMTQSGQKPPTGTNVKSVNFVVSNEFDYAMDSLNENLVCQKNDNGDFVLVDLLQERKKKIEQENSVWKRTIAAVSGFLPSTQKMYSELRPGSASECYQQGMVGVRFDSGTSYCDCAKKSTIYQASRTDKTKALKNNIRVDLRVEMKDGSIFERPWLMMAKGKSCTDKAATDAVRNLPKFFVDPSGLDTSTGLFLARTPATPNPDLGRTTCRESNPLFGEMVIDVSYSCIPGVDEAPSSSKDPSESN